MYLSGFGNHHQTEAIVGALPKNQNSPLHCELGLFAEQLSGSAFTRARHQNLHSWLYRLLPSVVHNDFVLYEKNISAPFVNLQAPNPYRWSPFPKPEDTNDFVDSLFHIAGSEQVNTYLYQCTTSMVDRYFSNNDGEMLIVPYRGEMTLFTEFGRLSVKPGMIAVIPRGVYFCTKLHDSLACGYVCENNGSPLSLPNLGLMGANGLANPRHFLYPQAQFENTQQVVSLICKSDSHLWHALSQHSPLNVVAWHGNYAPYTYDLSLFNTINTVSFDHPDPSIFTVLSSESDTPGVANLDFVIFPQRWLVAEHTFRPPYFHRNIMSELMGLITGEYDAKKEGFLPGGISIHNAMTAHGPDTDTYKNTLENSDLKPLNFTSGLAFMFEIKDRWKITEQAMAHVTREKDYSNCWQGLESFKTQLS